MTRISDQRRQELLSHRAGYVHSAGSQSDSFDKNLLLLSGGALGLSAVLLDSTRWLPTWHLLLSWVAFSISICLVLVSFKVSEKQFDADIASIDTALKDGVEVAFEKSNWSKKLVWINAASGFCFLIGAILFLWFSTQTAMIQNGVLESGI